MSDKIYVGSLAASLESAPPVAPYTRVVLIKDEDTTFVAGNTSGQSLIKRVPWATQAMANTMLENLSKASFRPFSSRHTVANPAMELGDAVTIGGIYSQIGEIVTSYDAEMSSTLKAPFEDEFQDEFPYRTTEEKLSGQLAGNWSAITKTAEKILLEVRDDLKNYSTIKQTSDSISTAVTSINESVDGKLKNYSTIKQTSDSISTAVTSINESVDGKLKNYSTIKQTSDSISTAVSGFVSGSQVDSKITTALNGIELSVSNGIKSSTIKLKSGTTEISSGTIQFTGNVVFASDLSTAGQTSINGANLMTGTVTAYRLQADTIRLRTSDEKTVARFYLDDADTADYKLEINADAIAITTSPGNLHLGQLEGSCFLQVRPGAVVVAGTFRPNEDNEVNLGTSANRWEDIYAANDVIQTSDRNRKKDIEYGLSQYDAFFDRLSACSYRMVDGHERRHWGFVAQDIEQLLNELGIDSMDIAAFIKSPREENQNEFDYGLRYGEFTALIVEQIQNLKRRMSALEEKL